MLKQTLLTGEERGIRVYSKKRYAKRCRSNCCPFFFRANYLAVIRAQNDITR